MRCARVKGLPAGGYFSLPLAAQGETLGMLPGVSALFRCDFLGSCDRSDGDPGTPGLGGGQAPVVGSISYGDLLAINKTARPPVTDLLRYNVAVCARFPPKLHCGIQTLGCRSLLFNASKQQVARSMQWAT